MFRKFKFEDPLYTALEAIPCSTRYKFEVVGLSVEDAAWNRLPLEERRVLCHLSVRSQGEREAYRAFLVLCLQRSGVEPRFVDAMRFEAERTSWENPARMPSMVVEASFRAGLPLRAEDWLRFDDMERYVLYRVAREDPERMARVLAELIKGGRKGPHGSEGDALRRAHPEG